MTYYYYNQALASIDEIITSEKSVSKSNIHKVNPKNVCTVLKYVIANLGCA